ncbi:MAG: amidase family protein [Geminicoccaceae bacterium]
MPLDPILALDATELAARIARRELSPVEVVAASLARLDETEPTLNAFVAVDRDGARAAAVRAEQAVRAGETLGPLHGVPVSVKDLIDVAGLPARYGSLTLQDQVAGEDAPSVARLRAAGAIVIGKTTTSELGYRGYTKSLVHGNTANPWDPTRTPGGSSGGAVASVAAGVIAAGARHRWRRLDPLPAAFTGLVGIKAQFGRVPVWPASATPTLAHVGPLARSVADAALLLDVVAGPHPGDPSFLPEMEEPPAAATLTDLRIAFAPTSGYGHVDEPVARAVAAAVSRLGEALPSVTTVDSVCRTRPTSLPPSSSAAAAPVGRGGRAHAGADRPASARRHSGLSADACPHLHAAAPPAARPPRAPPSLLRALRCASPRPRPASPGTSSAASPPASSPRRSGPSSPTLQPHRQPAASPAAAWRTACRWACRSSSRPAPREGSWHSCSSPRACSADPRHLWR